MYYTHMDGILNDELGGHLAAGEKVVQDVERGLRVHLEAPLLGGEAGGEDGGEDGEPGEEGHGGGVGLTDGL